MSNSLCRNRWNEFQLLHMYVSPLKINVYTLYLLSPFLHRVHSNHCHTDTGRSICMRFDVFNAASACVRGDVGVHNCCDGFSPYDTHLLYDQLFRLSTIDSKWLRCRSGFECLISSEWENPFIVTISSEHVYVWDRILIRLWNIYRNMFRFIVLGTHARI